MSSRRADFLRIPAGLVELLLTGLDAGTKTMRSSLETIVPSKPAWLRIRLQSKVRKTWIRRWPTLPINW
jgi:hypothetical protein